MKKTYLIFTICFLTTLSNSAQNDRNDTIFKRDGTKIIDDFAAIIIQTDEIKLAKVKESSLQNKKLKPKDLIWTIIPVEKIDKVIDNDVELKFREFLNDDDEVWESKFNNNKKKVYVHERKIYKNVILPNGKQRLLELLVEGKCDLYVDITSSASNDGIGSGDSFNYRYYVRRKGEEKSTLFKGFGYLIGSKFKSYYFDDCPKAKEFIEKHEKITGEQLIELVNLYNESCN